MATAPIPVLMYPLDMQDQTYYGNNSVLFKASEWRDPQAKNPENKSSASVVPTPQNVTSGAPVSSTAANSPSGVFNPVTAPIPDPTQKYKGENLGDLVLPVSKIDGYIQLYIPTDFAISYNATWEEENFPIIGNVAEQALAVGNLLKRTAASDAIVAGLGAMLVNDPRFKQFGGNYFLSQAGKAPNPRKALLFKDIAFREFQFTYEFFVKNDAEARTVRDIIYTFKKAMHPGTSGTGGSFLYDYPNEFEIKYYVNNVENPFLHRHKRCVLTGMDVRLAPQGLWVSHADGSPTNTTMILRFKEVEVLTREDFAASADGTPSYPTY